MPIVSQSARVRENLLGLVNNILRGCGEKTITTTAGTVPDKITELVSMINLTQEEIYSEGDWWFKQEDWFFGPEQGVAIRDLPLDFDDLFTDPRDPSRNLRFVPPQDLDAAHQLQDTVSVQGSPSRFYLYADGADNGRQQLKLWPPPDANYCANKVVSNGGVAYVCKDDHTAAAANEPGVGADWEDYWAVDSGLTLADATAWVTATDYKAGRIQLRYMRRPQAMGDDSHYPDLPDKFIDILKTGARARYKQFREFSDWGEETSLYNRKLKKAVRRYTQVRKGHRVRMFR